MRPLVGRGDQVHEALLKRLAGGVLSLIGHLKSTDHITWDRCGGHGQGRETNPETGTASSAGLAWL